MVEKLSLYHATSLDSFLSILQSGELKPQAAQMSDWTKEKNIDRYFDGNAEEYIRHLKNYIGYVFFATNQYSSQRYGVRASDKSNFKNMYVIIETQLHENLLLPDLNDAINAETWQDSAKEVGQVSVYGSVKNENITSIIIVVRDLHLEIKTTIHNWKVDLKTQLASQVRRGYFDIDDCYELWDKLGIPNTNTCNCK